MHLKQYFDLWTTSAPITAEYDHWVKWGKLLNIYLCDEPIPINVETVGDFPRRCKQGELLNVELRFFLLQCEIFSGQNDFNARSTKGMASEALIPCGTFSVDGNADFKESAEVLLNGRIISAARFKNDCGENCYKFELGFQGYVFRAVALGCEENFGLNPGDIIHGLFTVCAVIKRAAA